MKRSVFWIAVPDSVLEEDRTLMDKTLKIGLIARACAIFQVSRIYVYRDRRGAFERDFQVLKTILEYMDTPQYLRKRLYGKDRSLRYVGMLPPLRTPHHKLQISLDEVKEGEFRDGVVVKLGGSFYVDVGLSRLIPLEGSGQEGSRVTVRFIGRYPNLGCRIASRDEVGEYWGFHVYRAESLAKMLRSIGDVAYILTSRRGVPIQDVWNQILEEIDNTRRIMLVFGSPRRGVFEILGDEGVKPSDLSYLVVNMVPDQGVATVRTEEAITISLAIINLAAQIKIG